jgi:phosphatidyl-myo-inositol dimannoside synthase
MLTQSPDDRDISAKLHQSKARVLFVTEVFPPTIGGSGAVTLAIANAFPDLVAVVAPRMTAEAKSVEEWKEFDARFPFKTIRVYSFHENVRWFSSRMLKRLYDKFWVQPKVRRELRRLLASHQFNVVCLNSIAYCSWLPPMLRQINPHLKTIIYAHGEEWSNITRAHAGHRIFHSLAKTDAFVAVSAHTKSCVISYGIPAERVHIVNNGVDLNRFSPGPSHLELLKRWGIQGRLTILSVARLVSHKGHDTLIAAMPAVLQRVPEAVLVIVGDGSEAARLRALVIQLRLQASVVFTGKVPDDEVVAWYRTADLYALANRAIEGGDAEGFGLVFLEAGACGLPVIGGRAGGVPDAIRDGETGFLVDSNSVSDVAEACLRLLLDSKLRTTMGRNGRAHALRNSWPQQAAKFLDICNNIAAK